MIKLDIVNRVAERTGVPKMKAEEAVEALFNSMKDALTKGSRIELRGFGVFVVKPTNAASGATRAPAKKWRFLRAKPFASNLVKNYRPSKRAGRNERPRPHAVMGRKIHFRLRFATSNRRVIMVRRLLLCLIVTFS